MNRIDACYMLACTMLTRSIVYKNVLEKENMTTTIKVDNNRVVRIVRNPIVRNNGTIIVACQRYAKKLNATFAIADVRGMQFEEW